MGYHNYIGNHLFYKENDNYLYRTGLKDFELELLEKIKDDTNLIKFEKTNDLIDIGLNKNCYKINKLPYEIRIQDLTREQVKIVLCDLIDFIVRCINKGVCVWDITESNFLFWDKKLYWVDLDAFSELNDQNKNTYYTFVKMSYMFNKYVKKNNNIKNVEDANYETILTYNDWTSAKVGSNFNDVNLWLEFKKIIKNTIINVPSSHWSDEYASNYKNLENDNKVVIFKSLLHHIDCRSALDIGCNKGYYLKIIENELEKCVGIDSDEKSIDIANKSFCSNKLCFVNFGIQEFDEIDSMRIVRFKSDLVIGLAITHHLHNANITANITAKTICDLSNKYIIIEDIEDVEIYHQIFINNGFKLIRTVPSYPNNRSMSLWIKF